MVIQLRDAYHHWVATKYQVDTMIASAIKEADQATPWNEEQLVNVCPPCFNFSDEDEDCTIWITMDGNMQHARLKRHTWWEFEIFKPKLFVDYGRKKHDFATSTNEYVNTIIPSNSCGLKYKATDGWNRPETITTTKKVLDESGVVGITCFCGINLRFLNIYGGGERQSHGVRLIEAVLHKVPHFARLKLWYDVTCVFESALYRNNPDWMEVVEARIRRLHVYGHEYRCHVLNNHLHTANHGLMVGEESEHLWYMMQQLIRLGGVSWSSRQSQMIDLHGRYWPIYLDSYQC